MKACVVMDGNFPKHLVIGKNDLVAQGWKGPWDKPGTIGLTVDSTVLVPFASADGSLMLEGPNGHGGWTLHNGYLGMEAVELGRGAGQETLFLGGCERTNTPLPLTGWQAL